MVVLCMPVLILVISYLLYLKIAKILFLLLNDNSENYECANMTCDLNNCTNVILRQKALGDYKTTVNLKIKHDNKSIGGLSKIVSVADKDTEKLHFKL